MTPIRAALGLAAVLVLAAVAAVGCHDYDDDDYYDDDDDDGGSPTSVSTEFRWEIDALDYTADEAYVWESIFEDAFVEFEGFDFEGSVQVEIFDATDTLIYSELYVGTGGYQTDLDQTLIGVEGDWVIRISSISADGHLRVSVF